MHGVRAGAEAPVEEVAAVHRPRRLRRNQGGEAAARKPGDAEATDETAAVAARGGSDDYVRLGRVGRDGDLRPARVVGRHTQPDACVQGRVSTQVPRYIRPVTRGQGDP